MIVVIFPLCESECFMTRDTSMRQGGRRYNFAEHGNSEFGSRQGQYLVRNNLAEVWGPTFGNGTTTIRAFPAKNPDDPTGQAWDPYRLSGEPNHFGDWLRRYPAIRSFGDPGVTMIIGDPANPQDDKFASPAWVLYNSIDRAVANKQDQQGWAGLLRGGAGRGAQLCKPSEVYLVQGCIIKHKEKVYSPPQGLAPDHKLVVFSLSTSAGQAMMGELNKVREGYTGSDADWEQMYANGDPVGLDAGRFITFYKLADGDPRVQQTPVAQAGWNLQSPQGGRNMGQSRSQEPAGYGCFMEPAFGNISAAFRPYEGYIAGKVMPWEQLLYFPTIDEQAMRIADKFPVDVIMYAWRDHPQWIPDSVRQRAVAAVSAAVPAFPQGYGAPGGFGLPGMPPMPAGSAPGSFPPAGAYSPPTAITYPPATAALPAYPPAAPVAAGQPPYQPAATPPGFFPGAAPTATPPGFFPGAAPAAPAYPQPQPQPQPQPPAPAYPQPQPQTQLQPPTFQQQPAAPVAHTPPGFFPQPANAPGFFPQPTHAPGVMDSAMPAGGIPPVGYAAPVLATPPPLHPDPFQNRPVPAGVPAQAPAAAQPPAAPSGRGQAAFAAAMAAAQVPPPPGFSPPPQ